MTNVQTSYRPRNARRARVATPALDAWRRELAARSRTPETFDPLWRAACAEMNAHEAAASGLVEAAVGYREEARRIVRRAAQVAR